MSVQMFIQWFSLDQASSPLPWDNYKLLHIIS